MSPQRRLPKTVLRNSALLFAGCLLMASAALAAEKINTTLFGNLAVEGYDVVAYFTRGEAVKGKKAFQWQWHNANWRFSTAENLALFKRTPQRFMPQYGGYCAYAVSQRTSAGIDPRQFTVYQGRLYLNHSRAVREKWHTQRDAYIRLADAYWPTLVH